MLTAPTTVCRRGALRLLRISLLATYIKAGRTLNNYNSGDVVRSRARARNPAKECLDQGAAFGRRARGSIRPWN
eukprot:scaffold55869_cov27-Tisochrysis_lutea.AAC.1